MSKHLESEPQINNESPENYGVLFLLVVYCHTWFPYKHLNALSELFPELFK